MPYTQKYQVGITYEVESTQFVLTRQDFTVFEWISNVGGLGFLFSAATLFVGWLNSPQMWITSAMLASGKEHTILDGRSNTLSRQLSMSNFSHEKVQQKCCADLSAKWAQMKCVPRCCRGRKARILSLAHEDLKKEMHVTHLLKSLRVLERCIREKFEIDEREWKIQFAKFSTYVAKVCSDSDESFVDKDLINKNFDQGSGI